MKTGDGSPAGRGHHVLEPARMFVRFEEQLRRSEERLGCQELRSAPRESNLHPGVAECLENQENIRGTRPRKTRYGIHQRLIQYDRDADGIEDPLGIAEIGLVRVLATCD